MISLSPPLPIPISFLQMKSYSKLRFWCKTDNRWTGPSGRFNLLSLAQPASLFGKPLEVVCGILAFWAPHLKTSVWISSSPNFLNSGPSPSTCLIPFSVDSYHLCLRLEYPLPKSAICIASPHPNSMRIFPAQLSKWFFILSSSDLNILDLPESWQPLPTPILEKNPRG